ncbi:dihydrofolate reductase family protein [Saccharomonospora iraqiensis]|uniref:dihydrofolate reductase family protein n=1 Tax=Saccharomonospora iraqiensis TaxID=52698 RepID=UPI00022E0747|nr:dihydrofolate reductase family protein [Saccharomonospora iraqiensis]
MGKVIITVQMSADASIGPDIGWFEGGEHEYAGEQEIRLADAFLLGRRTYEALAPIWLATSGTFAEKVNGIPKYVASRSASGEPLRWNATALKGDLAGEVRRLKGEHEGDLLTYGCGEFAFELVRSGLADEIRFWVHPIVWSESRRPFHGLGPVRMSLKDSTVFRNGVVRQTYEPVSVE